MCDCHFGSPQNVINHFATKIVSETDVNEVLSYLS